ncbi:MAG: hypothetical protein PHV74_07680 [Dehalococcoidia bacterium]|nr:hypothetical protein [Dehalococcoidia bacterium]
MGYIRIAMQEILVFHPCDEEMQSVVPALLSAGFRVVNASAGLGSEDHPILLPPNVVMVIDDSPKGAEVCAWVRSNTDVPILALCKRDEDMQRMLETGADVCLKLPVSAAELIARFHSLFRRHRLKYSYLSHLDPQCAESRKN